MDINLRGMMAFEVARTLEQLAIPFVFATGYGQASIPPEFDYVTRLEKPFSNERFLEAIASL